MVHGSLHWNTMPGDAEFTPVLIIGAGPAGAAVIYAARASLDPGRRPGTGRPTGDHHRRRELPRVLRQSKAPG